jgi:hypothetical protein
MSKPNLICQKTRKSFRSLSLSLGLFILVIDELWPDRRTSCGKKWMVLTQLGRKRKQRSSRVLNMNQCIINIIERRKKDSLSFKSHFTIGWSHIYVCLFFFLNANFYFENRLHKRDWYDSLIMSNRSVS